MTAGGFPLAPGTVRWRVLETLPLTPRQWTVPEIAGRTGLSPDAVSRALGALIDDGLADDNARFGDPSTFTVTLLGAGLLLPAEAAA